MIRPFVPFPDKRLSMAAEPVPLVDDAIRNIWADMIDTMEAMPGQGVGLAAPQIGVMLQLAVIDASQERGQAVRMANPEVVTASDKMREFEEASPNLPGLHAKVARPDWVVVGYIDDAGSRVEQRFDGLWATSVQHQIDHLRGCLYIDRLSRVKRDILVRRAKKMREV